MKQQRVSNLGNESTLYIFLGALFHLARQTFLLAPIASSKTMLSNENEAAGQPAAFREGRAREDSRRPTQPHGTSRPPRGAQR